MIKSFSVNDLKRMDIEFIRQFNPNPIYGATLR